MRQLIAAILLLPFASCHSARDDAQDEVRFLEGRNASGAELCEAYTKLVEADIKARDSKNWDMDRLIQRNVCASARLDRRLRAEE